MQPTVGQQIGNYRILRLLGKGGTASVYLGEHLYLKSHAALKILHTALPDTEQFLTEARTLVGLAHPHIVRVLDFAVQDDVPFLVMDYASGGSIRQQYPVGTRLPLGTLVSYVQQMASALQYAHERCLIHRDIKPENMLLNAQHMLLLSDFGLSLFRQSANTYKEMGSRVDIAEFQIGLARVLTVQGELESARSLYQQSLTALLEIGDKEPLPACLEGLAMIALRQDELQEAAQLWARAEALRQTFGAPIPLIYRVTYEKEISAVRTRLGDENFTLVSAEGRIKPLEGMSATYPIEISSSQAAPMEAIQVPSLEGRSSDTLSSASAPSKKKTLYPDELTSREADVLRLLAQGWSDAEIAEQLVISPRTVNSHVTSIYRKIQVTSRSAATRYALEHQLI